MYWDCTADSASYRGPCWYSFFYIYAPATDSSKYPKAEEWAVFMHKGDSIMTDFDDVRTELSSLLQSAMTMLIPSSPPIRMTLLFRCFHT